MSGRCTGQLYQLVSANELPVGSYVAVNGPWDTFGAVRSSKLQDDGTYLNLIRGVPERQGERPLASW